MISTDLMARFERASTAVTISSLLEAADELSDERLAEVLVQRRLISLAFTPFYDMLIDALGSPTARLVCRQILREEYPDPAGNSPSHRELLVQDLVALGIDRDAVLRARPTAATADIILGSFELLFAAMRGPFRELVLITTAACYGELLVATEYQALRSRIIAGLGQNTSVFYIPHLAHDSGHAKRLLEEIALRHDPDNSEQADVCAAAIDRCVALKLAFYAQFPDDTVPSSG